MWYGRPMQAIRLTAWEQPARLVEVPAPEPGPGEVLVRVAGAGLCHSDLHLMHWRAGALPYALPFTLGHEVAGTVAALGPGAEGVELGEPLLVYGPWGCGLCRACSVGAEHLCGRAARGWAATAAWRSTWSCPRPASPCRSTGSTRWPRRRWPMRGSRPTTRSVARWGCCDRDRARSSSASAGSATSQSSS